MREPIIGRKKKRELHPAHLAAMQADGFFRAFTLLKDRRLTQAAESPASPDFVDLLPPMVVCLAFACETMLKALLVLHATHTEEGHNLQKLFEELPTDRRAAVKARMGDMGGQFDKTMAISAQAFEEWRYVHERPSTSVDWEFLEALYVAARVEKPELAPLPSDKELAQMKFPT